MNMNEKEIRELQEYNLEYMEAMTSEDEFGGDYTSSVELKFANKKIERLQQENQQLKEQNNSLRTRIKTIKRRRKLQSQKIRKYRELITNTQNKLQQKNEVIEEAIEYICIHGRYLGEGDFNEYLTFQEELPELLDILTKYKGDNNE